MKTIVIYKEQSDHARSVITFMHDFQRQTGRELESMDPETRAGSMFCETYDIMQYPTIVSLDENGVVQNIWPGLPLPTISEVSYYA